MTQQSNQYLALESRVNKLELQQTALSEKVDGGFAQMSRQLQQVLEAVAPAAGNQQRPRSPQTGTGDTPQPKHARVQ